MPMPSPKRLRSNDYRYPSPRHSSASDCDTTDAPPHSPNTSFGSWAGAGAGNGKAKAAKSTSTGSESELGLGLEVEVEDRQLRRALSLARRYAKGQVEDSDSDSDNSWVEVNLTPSQYHAFLRKVESDDWLSSYFDLKAKVDYDPRRQVLAFRMPTLVHENFLREADAKVCFCDLPSPCCPWNLGAGGHADAVMDMDRSSLGTSNSRNDPVLVLSPTSSLTSSSAVQPTSNSKSRYPASSYLLILIPLRRPTKPQPSPPPHTVPMANFSIAAFPLHAWLRKSATATKGSPKGAGARISLAWPNAIMRMPASRQS